MYLHAAVCALKNALQRKISSASTQTQHSHQTAACRADLTCACTKCSAAVFVQPVLLFLCW